MNVKKIITLLIIILLLLSVFLTPKTFAISDAIKAGKSFLSSSSDSDVTGVIDKTKIKSANSRIYNILLGVGIAAAVIVGAVLGIQFIFASAEGKAKISETLVPYLVGCFVVFGAFGIWGIAINAGNEIMPSESGTSVAPTTAVVICPICNKQTTLSGPRLIKYKNGGSFRLDCGDQYTPGTPGGTEGMDK